MDFRTLWKHVALFWISILLSGSSFASDSPLPIPGGKKLMTEFLQDVKVSANSTDGDMSVYLTTTVPSVQSAHAQTVIPHTQTEITGTTNGNWTSNATMPELDDAQSTVTANLTSTMKTATAMHVTGTALDSSFNESLPTTTQPYTFHPATSDHKVEVSTDLTTANDTIVSDVLNTDSSGADAYPLSPTILAVIAVVATILFFVILYAIFKLVQSFTAVRFRRLHEMPMDDFDDFSGVYVEHTVPFRA